MTAPNTKRSFWIWIFVDGVFRGLSFMCMADGNSPSFYIIR
ncbi:MAG: hypothetical protein WBC26_00235 [Alphaproteobacteria bacterium]